MPSKELQNWSDVAMYPAAPVNAEGSHDGGVIRPVVTLVSMTPYPLRTMAAASELYRGSVVRDPQGVMKETALEWWRDMTKTRLQTPLEFIDLHFLFENVPRSFTHQLVRQRTAAYVQESQRFAVKEDASYGVSMPPSIEALPEDHPARVRWHNAVVFIGDEYLSLVNEGIPAEDARGLLPTDILTKVHYKTNLRNLVEHAGNRLCTQAQFEWRVVWAAMIAAIRARGAEQKRLSNRWEYDTIADIFRPICYFTGKCEFMAATDRYCSIRDRVENFHKAGVPSERWSDEKWGHPFTIRPQEWLLNPAAARTTSLHWRQEGTTS